MTEAIEVKSLTRRFGSLRAVDDVSFSIEEGTICGLLGRNGAGKTTLMQLLTGQDFATSGSIRVFGESPVENARVLQNVCFIKESQKYPDDFRVKHVMKSAPWFFQNWDAEFADQLVDEFRLPLGRKIKKLSRGQLSSVGIIIDDSADNLRGTATTVVGAAKAVDEFARDHEVLHRDRIGGISSVMLRALSPLDKRKAGAAGLELSPVSLQQLIIQKTGSPQPETELSA